MKVFEILGSLFPNFKKSEFKCSCGKCGKDGDGMDPAVLFILQAVRNKYGVVTVTCGERCQEYNDSLTGSIKNSDHIKGKAADFKCATTGTLSGRKDIMNYIMKLPGFKYAYCAGFMLYANGTSKVYNAPWMGNAIHVSVK